MMEPFEQFSDPLFRDGMGSCWSTGNSLIIFPTKHVSPLSQDEPSAMAPCSPTLYDVRWHVALRNPIARKLVCESHSVFLSLQKYASETSKELKSGLTNFSRCYRSILSECLINLSKTVEEGKYRNEEEKSFYESQFEMFCDIHLIWNLCEILFLDRSSPIVALGQLLDWIRWHFREPDKKILEIIASEEREKHEHYWKVIYQFMLQGRVQDSRKALRLHPLFINEEFQIMDDLLRRMPQHAQHAHLSFFQFKLMWQEWQDECKRCLANGDFSSSPNLEMLCRILSGDVRVFYELNDYCETWYYLLISRLFFTDACIEIHKLQAVAKECVDLCGGPSELPQVDQILYSAIQLDLQQVIKNCCYFRDNWWFVSHLTDLLHHLGQLEMMHLSHSAQLRESFLLEYAATLVSHESLWQVGIGYLVHCPFQGRAHMEHHFERIPLDNEYKALKLLNIAESHEIKDLAKVICKVMGLRSLKNNRLGNALSWAMRSRDAAFASFIADKFLTAYSMSGQFSKMDLLENLGLCMLASDQLTFLGKYCEFHRLYKSKLTKEAGELLVDLLQSKLAPKHFHPTLLLDALPLLELDVFNREQTFNLLQSLDSIVSSDDLEAYPRLKDNEKMIHQALTRNYSRAFLEKVGSDVGN